MLLECLNFSFKFNREKILKIIMIGLNAKFNHRKMVTNYNIALKIITSETDEAQKTSKKGTKDYVTQHQLRGMKFVG